MAKMEQNRVVLTLALHICYVRHTRRHACQWAPPTSGQLNCRSVDALARGRSQCLSASLYGVCMVIPRNEKRLRTAE